MSQTQKFEIPPQIRELAERQVDQARSAYGQFMDAMKQAQNMWSANMPSNSLTTGFKTVQERAVKFAQQNAESGFAVASEMAKAKDISEIISIQSRFAQMQMQAYALQAQELGMLMTKVAQEAQPKR